MKKQRTLLILGIFIALLPFTGFPNSWRKTFFVLAGLSVSYIAYLLYREKTNMQGKMHNKSNTYTDNR